MSFELVATSVSLVLCLLPSLLLVRQSSGSVFVLLHLVFVALFVPGLHLAALRTPLEWESHSYLAAHAAWVIYVWVFYGLTVWLKDRMLSDGPILELARSTPDTWLIGLFVTWVGFKVYLISVYGVNAFAAWRVLEGPETSFVRYAGWQTAVDQCLAVMGAGACVIYVVKAVTVPGYWTRASVTLPMLAFFLPYMVALESPIGSRRFVMMLALICLLVMWRQAGEALLPWVRKNWGRVALVMVAVLAVSLYYQSVRNNIYQADIASRLTSKETSTVLKGVGMTLVPPVLMPNLSSGVIAEVGRAGFINRDGPLRLTYRIIKARLEGQPGTGGDITRLSFIGIVPRAIAGNSKLYVNADDVIASEMHIVPEGPYLVPDLTTSLPAIFVADFGGLGVLMAPLAMALGFLSLYVIARMRVAQGAPWLLFWLGSLTLFVGSVETDLGGILATIRNGLLLLPLAAFANVIALAWAAKGAAGNSRVDPGRVAVPVSRVKRN